MALDGMSSYALSAATGDNSIRLDRRSVSCATPLNYIRFLSLVSMLAQNISN